MLKQEFINNPLIKSQAGRIKEIFDENLELETAMKVNAKYSGVEGSAQDILDWIKSNELKDKLTMQEISMKDTKDLIIDALKEKQEMSSHELLLHFKSLGKNVNINSLKKILSGDNTFTYNRAISKFSIA